MIRKEAVLNTHLEPQYYRMHLGELLGFLQYRVKKQTLFLISLIIILVMHQLSTCLLTSANFPFPVEPHSHPLKIECPFGFPDIVHMNTNESEINPLTVKTHQWAFHKGNGQII